MEAGDGQQCVVPGHMTKAAIQISATPIALLEWPELRLRLFDNVRECLFNDREEEGDPSFQDTLRDTLREFYRARTEDTQ